MIIFASMLIPFVTAAVLWFKYNKETTWWEILIPFAASFVFSIIAHFTTSFISAQKEEFWTGWITSVNYFEEWNEKVYYTERVPDGKETYIDSDGKKRTRTKYKTVKKSRIDTHPPYWEAHESNGAVYNITASEYKRFVYRWGNEKFIDMYRNYHSKDGDQYVVAFNGRDEDMEVATTSHSYQNKVILSRSVFNFKDVTEQEIKDFGLVKYPTITNQWDMPSILGNVVPGFDQADRRLSVFNARKGATKQVRVWIIIFKDKTLESAVLQQSYWKNGNMNEFVICVGVDRENNVTWGKTFSWTDSSKLIVESNGIVNDQIGKKVDLAGIVSWVERNVPKDWVRKSFKKDFNYINISPPWWAILLTFILTALLNVGIIFWITGNEFDEITAKIGSQGRNRYGHNS